MEIKRTIFEYVKTLCAQKSRCAGAGAGPTSQDILAVNIDAEGFPVAPSPVSWEKISKDDLERMYRTYMTLHYRLASRDPEHQTPFTRISAKQSDFIQAKYIPRGITLNDPQAMKREAMIQFFQHVVARQESHGNQDAFRFKAILSSRKKGTLRDAKYFDADAGVNEPAPAPAPRRKKKAPKATHDTVIADLNCQEMAQDIQYSVTDNDPMMTFSDDPVIMDQPQALPSLILDLAYNFDRPFDLDPSLDPSLCPGLFMESLSSTGLPSAPAFNSELCQGWIPAPACSAINPQSLSETTQLDPVSPWVPAVITTEPLVFAPAPAPAAVNTTQMVNLLPVHPAVSPRRKGKNAETLAREEAQKYGATSKRRR
ncbi:hypothetical protein BYT27DRAFT_7258411 [Phlegmacium glaucopus]|nr:hypothetical protein BYT27DRAFT_7258411 [Phlegmacium glaucopus]